MDCDLYNLGEKQALEYIKERLGKEISGRTYRRYRENVRNGIITNEWLNYYTKVGFAVQHQGFAVQHQERVENAKHIHELTLRMLDQEQQKPNYERNNDIILRLKQHARENIKLISDLSLGTPIVSQIKKKIQELEGQLDAPSSSQSFSNNSSAIS